MCNKCMCLTSNSYFCVFAAKPKSLLQAEDLQAESDRGESGFKLSPKALCGYLCGLFSTEACRARSGQTPSMV